MPTTAWADATANWAGISVTWAYPGVTELSAKFEWSPTTAPGASPVCEDITERVRPIVTSLGDSEDDQYAHVNVRGTYFMGPLDGGFNAVRIASIYPPDAD